MDRFNKWENPSAGNQRSNAREYDQLDQPLDFSTRKEEPQLEMSEKNRPWMSPESGVSSLEMGSPSRFSPDRDYDYTPNKHFPNWACFEKVFQARQTPDKIVSEAGAVGRNCTVEDQYPPQGFSFAGVSHSQPAPNIHALVTAIQQNNPVLLNALCNLGGQRTSNGTTDGHMPSTSSGHIANVPLPPTQATSPFSHMPFLGYQAPPTRSVHGHIPGFAPAMSGPFPLAFEEENLTAKSNESYFKFRAEMLGKGQRSARRKTRRGQKNKRHKSDSSCNSGGSDCEKPDGEQQQQQQQLQSGEIDPNDPTRDPNYWLRRKKNNEAAKRSRDARRAKEDETAIRAAFLETENVQLRLQVAELRRCTNNLYAIQNMIAAAATAALAATNNTSS